MNTPFNNLIKQGETKFPRGLYNNDPFFQISKGKIDASFESIFSKLKYAHKNGCNVFVFEGYNGVDWRKIKNDINKLSVDNKYSIDWLNIEDCLLSYDVIEKKVENFLGGKDPLWGSHFPMGLESFMDAEKIASARKTSAIKKYQSKNNLFILYGCGASTVDFYDFIVYFDIPKDRIQEIARNKELLNIGCKDYHGFGYFYKRSYFIDWPAQNRKKRELVFNLDLLVDFQDEKNPTMIDGNEFRHTLYDISERPFRVRPWFYPGPWGGNFMQGHMGLDPEQPNFAWSFEMIAPENGITIKSGNVRLEFSFDFIMYQENKRVLGKNAARRFQYEWPIRMDYLDTINGGNLSTQCHPRPNFMIENFGETFTQDETYYISVAKDDAKVFVGLKEGVEKEEFKQELLSSEQTGAEVDITSYIHSVDVKPHDLILIPNGTVHCSGEGNLVLEISATPYIFTFKIYDYLRKDLNGNLRKLNIERAFENIREERTSDFIDSNYLPEPKLIEKGEDWANYELYNRDESFYNINRLEFQSVCYLETKDRGLLINLVEGHSIDLVSTNGYSVTLNLYETMVVPAAAFKIKLTNNSKKKIKLVYTFVRESAIIDGLNHPYS